MRDQVRRWMEPRTQTTTQIIPTTMLVTIVRFSGVLTLLHLVFMLVIFPRSLFSIALDVLLFILLAGANLLLQERHTIRARWLYIVALWLYVTIGVIFLGGVENPLFASFLIVVLVAALIFDQRITQMIGTITLGTMLGITVCDALDWLPAPLIELTTIYVGAGMLANMALTAIIVYATIRRVTGAVRDVEHTSTALERERNNLRTLIDNLPDALYIKDSAGRYIVANRAHAQRFALASSEQMHGHSDQELGIAQHPLQADDPAVLAGGQAVREQEMRLTVGSEDRLYSISRVPLHDSNQTLGGMVGVIRDVTAARAGQIVLMKQRENAELLQTKLRLLHEAALELGRIESFDLMCLRVVELTRSKLDFDRAALFMYDEKAGIMRGTYGTDMDGNIRDERSYSRLVRDDPRVSEMLQARQRMMFWQDVELKDMWQAVGTGWNMLAMVWDGDRTIGWIAVDNLLNRQPVAPHQIELLTMYGATIGHLLSRRAAEDQLQRSQSQLRRRSDALMMVNAITEILYQSRDLETLGRNAVKAVQSYLNAYGATIYRYDPQHDQVYRLYQSGNIDDIRDVSRVVPMDDSLTGYAIRTGKTVTASLTDPGELPFMPVIRERLQRQGVQQVTSVPIIYRDQVLGSFNLAFTEEVPESEERVQTYTAIGHTIGLAMANVIYYEEAKSAGELSSQIIDSFPGIFCMFSEQGELLRWNDTFLRQTGLSPEGIPNLHMVDLFDSNQAAFDEFVRMTLEQGSGYAPLMLRTGQRDTAYIFTARRFVLGERVCLICTGIDVSERNRLLERLQLQTTRLQTAGEVSKSLVTLLNTDELLQQTVDLICERLGYYYVGVFGLDQTGMQAVLRAGSGETGRQMVAHHHRLEVGGSSMIGQAIFRQLPLIANDVVKAEVHYMNPWLPETRSEMAIPVIYQQKVFGAITVQNATANAFDEDDIQAVQFVADHLASALENVRLVEAIQRRQRHLGTLRRISLQALPERTPRAYMRAVVTGIIHAFDYQLSSIFLLDQEKDLIYCGAVDSVDPEVRAIDWENITQSASAGIMGWVIKNDQPWLCRDTETDPLFTPRAEMKLRSIAAVPIHTSAGVIGTLGAGSDRPYGVNELDIEIMIDMAVEVGLQLENVMLFARTEQSAQELEIRVAERTSQLEAVNHELEAFAYSVSHDLRAPLRSIDGFSQALLEDYIAVLDENGQGFLRRIRAASQRMGILIDDLLALSRVTRRGLLVETLDLSQMVREIVAGLHEGDPQRDYELDIMPDLQAKGDPHLIRVALDNLLGNAWKFTVNSQPSRIEVGFQDDSETGRVFFVRDNGVGFNMEYAGKLFQVFQRLHSASEFEGTGIGLATVQRIILRHQGRIWAESAPGQGSTFYFTLG